MSLGTKLFYATQRFLSVWRDPKVYSKDGIITVHIPPTFDLDYFNSRSDEDLGIAWRFHVLKWFAQSVKPLGGNFVECGVWKGDTAFGLVPQVVNKMYLIDTFQGLDPKLSTGKEISTAPKFKPTYDYVLNRFASFHNVFVVKGRIPDILTTLTIDSISFLHIDMNSAYPEKRALEFFWPKLLVGSIVILDDYGHYEHMEQHRVHDDFASSVGVNILCLPTGQGVIQKR